MAASHTPVAIGAVLGDRYRLVAQVGTGVSARVYMGVDPVLRRRVAVKVLHEALAEDQAFIERFRREARTAAALGHDHIVKVLDWGQDDSSGAVVAYLVTEFLSGGSVASMLDAGRRLSTAQSLLVGRQAAEALEYAHARGLVHRDVKPANLLFDSQQRLRLADFGLARAIAEASWTEPAGSSVGTTRYASPEQVLGWRLDGRSDVYSLALVMMEAVTGVVPLLADSTAGTMGLRTSREVDVSMDFGRLRSALLRATALDPEERCDAGEFVIALKAAQADMDSPAALPLERTPGAAELTGELQIGHGPAGLAVLGPLAGEMEEHGGGVGTAVDTASIAVDTASIAVDAGPVTGSVAGTGSLADTGLDVGLDGPPSEGLAPLVRDPIVVATEHDALASSRPGSAGRVEPLDDGAFLRALGEEPTRPPRRRLRRVLAVVALAAGLVGGGAAWWFLLRTPTHEVPTWVGGDATTATSEAEELGWELDDPTSVRVDGTEPGEVVGQSPEAGTVLAEGERVALEVSLGPTLTALPALSGLTEAEADAALAGAGLVKGARSTAFDEKVRAGAVISATPAEGSEAPDAEGRIPKGTAIDVAVSDGPTPRTVPDGLEGAPQADAVAALEAVQLTAQVDEAYSDSVGRGLVISAGTPAGTQLPRGAEVGLVVSLGPAPVAIPNVVGQTGSAAASALEAAGFVVSGIEGSPSGSVLATDPVAGELHQKGTSVRVFTRQ